MQRISWRTSSGSIETNVATRSWLRPSLRYGSVSTMPLARRLFATAAASTDSSKSIVTTTGERSAGSATKGVANADASAQSYSACDDSCVRASAHCSPPLPLIQSSCDSSSASVVMRGGVERLVEARVVDRVLEAQELGDVAAGRGDALDPLDRGGRDGGEPQAAVGAEVLLRGEVVDVRLARSRSRCRRRRWSRR